MAPVIQTIGENRLADLFGTGGVHRAAIFEEAQTGGVKRQAEIVQQAAHLGFGIGHQILIDDTVNSPRLDLVKMGEQPDVVGVVAADMIQAESGPEAMAEVLPEH